MAKLVIISHTKHFYNSSNNIVGWEPTVREINHLATIFDTIYHVAPLYYEKAHAANSLYEKKINHFPLKPAGGKGFSNKLKILFFMPYNLWQITKIIKKSDYIHFRAPTNLGLYVLPFLLLYNNKKKWVKYAGNWSETNPPFSYRFQRWWLKNNFLNSKVTINGKWKNQSSHLLSFENPCISEEELYDANQEYNKKNYTKKINLCFVGRLEPAKGALVIFDLIKCLDKYDWISEICIVGDGPSKEKYISCKSKKLNLKGWLPRKELAKVYAKSHVILLPSYASEGFPKVIAEAASFGCVPLVCNQSSISQYIRNNRAGILLDDLSCSNLELNLVKLSNDRQKFIKLSSEVKKIASLFTYNRYLKRIKFEIIND